MSLWQCPREHPESTVDFAKAAPSRLIEYKRSEPRDFLQNVIISGGGAVGAMKNLNSCGLFPAVFTMPRDIPKNEVSTSYSEQGVALMEAAENLTNDWQPQVASGFRQYISV